MADVTLNKAAIRGGLSPLTNQRITLPTDHVPVFLFIGDSTSVGLTAKYTKTSTEGEAWAEYRYAPVNQVPDVGSLDFANTPSIAKIWSRFQHRNVDGGVDKVERGYRETTTTGGYTFAWQDADPRMGGEATQYDDGVTTITNFPYGSESGDFNNKHLIGSPCWNFALGIQDLFVDSNNDPVTPHIIYLGKASTRIVAGKENSRGWAYWGTAWDADTSATVNNNADTSIDGGGTIYEYYYQYYVKPAINALLTDGKTPVMAGWINILGGNDASNVADTILHQTAAQSGYPADGLDAGTEVWDWTLSSMEYLHDHLSERVLGNSTDLIPIVGYIPWRPTDETAVQFEGIYSLRTDLASFYTDPARFGAFFDPNDFDRDDDGVHFTPRGTMSYGMIAAATYRKLLTRKDVTLTAHEVTSSLT